MDGINWKLLYSNPRGFSTSLQNTKKIDPILCEYSQIENNMSENTISEEKYFTHLFQPMLNVTPIFIYD